MAFLVQLRHAARRVVPCIQSRGIMSPLRPEHEAEHAVSAPRGHRPNASLLHAARSGFVAALLLGLASAALAQQPSPRLSQKSSEAGELVGTAQQQGHVRVIVQFQAPVASTEMRADAATLANVSARVSAVQDAIISTHFVSAFAPREGQGFLRSITRFTITPGFAANVDAAELEALAVDPRVLRIHPDRLEPPVLNDSVPLIGMPAAYTAGATGTGRTVVVIDTGVKANHEFLNGKVTAEACFSNSNSGGGGISLCPNGTSLQIGAGAADPNTTNCNNGAATALNLCTHGTHVAGIAAGNNAGWTEPEPVNGVAKFSNVFAIQVFTRFNTTAQCGGTAPCVLAFNSDTIRALDHVLATLQPAGAPVASVNMSLGGGLFSSPCDDDPRKSAIDNLRAAGVLTTISAGNDSRTSQIGAPGCISSAITVGATTKNDSVASYSNMSSVVDLLAPGGSTGACAFTGSPLIVSSGVTNNGSQVTYACLAGTSMAAPHVAGAIAAIKSACPAATVDQIEAALISTGAPIADGRSGGSQTKNRIRVDQAAAAACGSSGPLMTVTPATHITASGIAGGPFSPSGFSYTIAASSGTLNWSITGVPGWLDVSSASGTADTAGTTVTFTVNASANTMPAGVQGPASITFTNTAATGLGTQTRTATLKANPPPPANDLFANAIELSPAGQVISSSTAGAREEAGEPRHDIEFPQPPGGSVWYSITPQSSGSVRVTTCPLTPPPAPILDSVIAVYTGTALNSLTRIAANTDANVPCDPPAGGLYADLTFNAAAGTTYWIAIDGWNTSQGNFVLTVTVPAQSLVVVPNSQMSISGPQGGPFTPSSFQYDLKTSSGAANYTISNVPTWLTPSSTSGTATTTGVPVTFTVNANDLAPGSYSATISFNNTTNGLGTQSRTATAQVTTVGSATGLISSANPSVSGQGIMFTATVTRSSGAGAPTGTVTFTDTTMGTVLGTQTLNAGGQASISTSSLSPGSHVITAAYSGDSNLEPSSASLTQTVTKATSTTVVASSKSPSVFGEPVTFTSTVTPNSPGAGPRTGTVTFKDGATTLGTGSVNASGQASFSTAALSTGSHQITAEYGGDGNFTDSSGSVAQTVNKGATATTLTSSANPSTPGQTVTLTATVAVTAPARGTPSGTVEFKDGATVLGSGALTGDKASFAAANLSVGQHAITAAYLGDGNLLGSTSPAVTQIVDLTCADLFADATALSGSNGTITGTTVSATGESGEPDHAGASTPLNSVWCKWAAPASGAVSFDTTGSLFDTTLAAYTGATVASLTPVAADDNLSGANIRSRIRFTAVQGATYYIAIDGMGAASGRYLLNWAQDAANASTYAAVLPYARSAVTGTPTTALATILNAGATTASGCSIAMPAGFPGTFMYQTTDAQNNLSGAPNTPVDIPPGAARTFMFAITPVAELIEAEFSAIFACANTPVTISLPGVNTFLLSASDQPTPDLAAVSVTPSQDGIVNIPGDTGTGFFVAAAINIGSLGTITATADDNGRALPLSLTICETNPATGACINPPAPTVSTTAAVPHNGAIYYTVFVQGAGNIAFEPASSRLFLRLRSADGVTRGATDVAVRTRTDPTTAQALPR
jgi:subtilisin family serine protease